MIEQEAGPSDLDSSSSRTLSRWPCLHASLSLMQMCGVLTQPGLPRASASRGIQRMAGVHTPGKWELGRVMIVSIFPT